MYDLNIPDDDRQDVLGDQQKKLKVPARGGKCPACNQKINDGAAICVQCGFNLQSGERVKTSVKEAMVVDANQDTKFDRRSQKAALAQGHDVTRGKAGDKTSRAYAENQLRWSEFVVPTGVLAISWTIVLLAYLLSWDLGDMAVELVVQIISWIINIVMLGVALLVMNKLMGTMTGSLSTVGLKLGALAIGMVAANILYALTLGQLPLMCFGIFLQIAVMFAVFYTFCRLFFEMEGAEPILFYILGYIVPAVIMIFAIGFLSF